jgi:hypothetical protein
MSWAALEAGVTKTSCMYGRVGCVGVRSSATKRQRVPPQTKKNDRTDFKDSVFGASNLKYAFANVDFDTCDVILNTKGAQFLKMSIRQSAI